MWGWRKEGCSLDIIWENFVTDLSLDTLHDRWLNNKVILPSSEQWMKLEWRYLLIRVDKWRFSAVQEKY